MVKNLVIYIAALVDFLHIVQLTLKSPGVSKTQADSWMWKLGIIWKTQYHSRRSIQQLELRIFKTLAKPYSHQATPVSAISLAWQNTCSVWQ